MRGGPALSRLALALAVCGLLAGYAYVIPSAAGLSPIDDHQLVRTILQGRPFEYYVMPDVGRFTPLVALDLVLASRLLAPGPELFRAVVLLKVLGCGALLLACLRLAGAGAGLSLVLWIAAMAGPGMATAALRLQVGELNSLLFLLAFAACALAHERRRLIGSDGGAALPVLGLAAMATATVYKEPNFIFPLVFALSEIVRARGFTGWKVPRHVWALLGLGPLWMGVYAAWRLTVQPVSYAGFWPMTLADALGQSAVGDPFIFFVALPLGLARAVLILRKKTAYGLHDSLLAAGLAFSFGYVAMRLVSPYYLQPAYAFLVPGVAGALAGLRRPAVRVLAATACALAAAFAAPVALSDALFLRTVVRNHSAFVPALAKWIADGEATRNGPARIVLAGVSPGTGAEIIFSLRQFLTYFGADERLFEIRTTEAVDSAAIAGVYDTAALGGAKPGAGDVLVFTPFQSADVRPPLLSPSYREIVRSRDAAVPPRWTAARWLGFRSSTGWRCAFSSQAPGRPAGYAAFEVLREPGGSVNPGPVEAPAFRLLDVTPPRSLCAGSRTRLTVTVRNEGLEPWPATGRLAAGPYVHLSYRWFDESGAAFMEGERAPLPETLFPAEAARVELAVAAPARKGTYRLAIAPVQEGVRWFEADGGFAVEVR